MIYLHTPILTHFNGDLSNWKPLKLKDIDQVFDSCEAPIPYWGLIKDNKERRNAIKLSMLNNQLNEDLTNNTNNVSKIKI